MPLDTFLNIVSHAAEIHESVSRIQARYFRETGKRLPLDEAYRIHDVEPDHHDIFPDRQSLVPARLLMVEKGYHDMAIAGAISDIARDGTAELSLWVDTEDRAEIEELIPGNPYQWGPETDADVWETVSII